MHPARKQRLILVIFIIVGSTLGISLIFFALKENLNLFYPPSKVLMGAAPEGVTIRAGGCVVPGSIKREDTSLRVHFDVTDGEAVLPVIHDGILPDLFAEGEATVLTGKYQDGVFTATEVLAKHDETYMPKEVADSIKDGTSEYSNHEKTCQVIDYGA